MKKARIIICLMLAIAMAITTVYASSNRASAQITKYYVQATPIGNGDINIYCSVTCDGIMQRVGVYSIDIDRKSGNTWVDAKTYNVNDEGMFTYDSQKHIANIIFTGTSGSLYRITATFFAKDTNGEDYKDSETFVVA